MGGQRQLPLPDDRVAGTLLETVRIRGHPADVVDLAVRRFLHALVGGADEADGHLSHHATSPHFLLEGFAGALAKETQLKLAHRPFEPEQQFAVEGTVTVVNDREGRFMGSVRMRCGIRSRRTYSRRGTTSGRCRNCSATATCRRQ